MDRTFVIFGLDAADYLTHAYHDLVLDADVTVVWRTEGRVLSGVQKVHMSYKVNSRAHLPFQSLWCKRQIRGVNLDQGGSYAFIFFAMFEGCCPDYLNYLRSQFPGSFFCLLVLNPLDSNVAGRVGRVESLYDSIITCSRADARAQGWHYHSDCYSAGNVGLANDAEFDICFIGADKGRVQKAHEVYTHLKSHGLRCDFWIVGGRGGFPEDEGFHYRDRMMPYKEYLKHVQDSRCLLEITANGQNYCTLRTMEAATYGRRLLTTNALLADEPFFDPQNMEVLVDAADIDVDALRRPYIGMPNPKLFAPSKLLSFIREQMPPSASATGFE
jgi:hypothetical protein